MEAQGYSKLVEALRCIELPLSCNECEYGTWSESGEAWSCECERRDADAADAIEALQAQLPKLGEWIKHPEVKNIYGGECIECPFCGEKYVVQYIADEKFCRNCGADMRAKMEVQDGE